VNDVVLKWIKKQAGERNFMEPIVEFGSLQVPGQEDYADVRRVFPGRDYIGCDFRLGAGVEVVDNMEFSRFPPESVGTVICLETLEHVKHPWLAVAEAFRILKPGGTLLVSMPFRLPAHDFPDDYWRLTRSGLEVLLRDAGFSEVDVADSGEETLFDLGWDKPRENPASVPYPFLVFGIARKSDSRLREQREVARGGALKHRLSYLPSSYLGSGSEGRIARLREPTPIVIAVFYREGDTRRALDHLNKVTKNYSLIIVNNGFDDPDYLKGLRPSHYIENDHNVGAMAAVNQGLDVAEGDYICVLHCDLLIYDDGWLDHILDFMDRRPDVGLVGLAGRHAIKTDGNFDHETTVFTMDGYLDSFKPSWRFSEVATIDGIGWVMRNEGFRLDEGLGIMHYYDLDLSLRYIEAGYRVYVAQVDTLHYGLYRSSRFTEKYLEDVGGDDDVYFKEVQERFRRKWEHMLPIVRGPRDERYGYLRIEELNDQVEQLNNENAKMADWIEKAAEYIPKLEEQCRAKTAEIDKAAKHITHYKGGTRNCQDSPATAASSGTHR